MNATAARKAHVTSALAHDYADWTPGDTLAGWLQARRSDGMTWTGIADAIGVIADADVSVSTLINWVQRTGDHDAIILDLWADCWTDNRIAAYLRTPIGHVRAVIAEALAQHEQDRGAA